MLYYPNIVRDDRTLAPIEDVHVSVLDSSGELATLLNGIGDEIPNPIITNYLGDASFYVADADIYTLTYIYGGRTYRKDADIIGVPPQFIGPAGPAGPTYLTLALFKAAPITNQKQALKAPGIADGDFYWTLGDFTGLADDINVIKADSTPLSVGAWVRGTAPTENVGGLTNGGAIDILYARDGLSPSRGNVHAWDTATIGTSQMLTNPTFAGSPATGWTLANMTSTNPGVSHSAGTVASAKQSVTFVPYTMYYLSITLTTTTTGNITFLIDGVNIFDTDNKQGVPSGSTKTFNYAYFSYNKTGSGLVEFQSDALWAGSISSLSLIQVAQEAPYDFRSISADKRDFDQNFGVKFGKYVSGNAAVGDRLTSSLLSSTASWVTAIGVRAMSSATNSIECTALGALALEFNNASRITAGGYSSLRFNQDGIENVAWGFKTLLANTTGSRGTAVGFEAGFFNRTADDNTYTGAEAGHENEYGSNNSAFGSMAGKQNNGGGSNAWFGRLSGPFSPGAVTFAYNFQSCFGAESKAYGNNTVVVGYAAQAGSDPNTGGAAIGTSAVVIGYTALANADETVVIGGSASVANAAWFRSVAIGKDSTVVGEQGTAIGFLTTATMFSIAAGSQAGRSLTGVQNTSIGVSANNFGGTPTAYDNTTAIGFNVQATKSNQVIIGNSSVVETVLRGVIRANTTYTVSGLPSAASAGAGARAFVTDANATTFAAIVAGGGSNGVPVYSDGTNWRIG